MALLFMTLFLSAVYVFADLYWYGKFRLTYVYCGDYLLINGAVVHSKEVVWIREIWLSGGRSSYEFIEIVFLLEGQEVRALCMAKPDGFCTDDNPSVTIMIRRIPELKDKVQFPFITSRTKRVHNPPRPELENEREPVRRNINPMARYRDPYFRRKR